MATELDMGDIYNVAFLRLDKRIKMQCVANAHAQIIAKKLSRSNYFKMESCYVAMSRLLESKPRPE